MVSLPAETGRQPTGQGQGLRDGRHSQDWDDVPKPESSQERQPEVDDAAEIAQRVRSGVAVVGGVRKGTDAHAVEHDAARTRLTPLPDRARGWASR